MVKDSRLDASYEWCCLGQLPAGEPRTAVGSRVQWADAGSGMISDQIERD